MAFEPRNRVYIGAKRQGKSVSMVHDVIPMLKHGIMVYSNLQIHVEGDKQCWFSYYLATGDEFKSAILKAYNAILVCDEIGLVFPAQQWQKLDMETLAIFKESGHVGVAFWGSTHTQRDIVGKLRYLMDDIIEVHKVKPFFGLSSIVVVKNWSLFFHILTHPTLANLRRLFNYKVINPRNLVNPMVKNDVFKTQPSFIIKQFYMKKSWDGSGTAKKWYASIIRKRKLYPREYLSTMRAFSSYTRTAWSGVMVHKNTGKFQYQNRYRKGSARVQNTTPDRKLMEKAQTAIRAD